MFNIYGFVTAQLGDVPPASWCRVVATTACEVRRLDSSYVHSVLADWHDLAHRFFQSAAWSLAGVLELLLTSQDEDRGHARSGAAPLTTRRVRARHATRATTSAR
jgi:hypothetical protein